MRSTQARNERGPPQLQVAGGPSKRRVLMMQRQVQLAGAWLGGSGGTIDGTIEPGR